MSLRPVDAHRPTRRRADWTDSTCFTNTVRMLVGRPTVDKLASAVALRVLGDLKPRSIAIGLVGGDGRLRVVSTFGEIPDSLAVDSVHSVWDATALCQVVHGDDVIVVDDLTPPQESVVVAAPLRTAGYAIGAIHVAVGRGIDVQRVQHLITAVAAPISLYVDLLASNGHADSSEARGLKTTDASGHSRELTDRQKVIVQLLTEGLTNSQIAARIGFSESTVRQETIAIYRHLGVSGRHEVALALATRGQA